MDTKRFTPLILPTAVLAAIILPFLWIGPGLEALSLEAVQGAKGWVVFSAVVALLALDVLLPVPSSVLSLFSGAALGFPVGALAIWTGMTLGCVLGGMIGRGLLKAKPGTEWLKPGLIGKVRHLKGEQQLRHATLREII